MLPQPAARQHPGDGLKPSLEIAPPGATPNHSGCPLGERPYGLEDAQGGCHPAPLSRRTQCASTKQATIGWKSVMSTILARRPGGTVPPRSWQEVPQVASRSRTATGSSHPGASTGGLAGSDVLRRPASEDLLGSSKRKKHLFCEAHMSSVTSPSPPICQATAVPWKKWGTQARAAKSDTEARAVKF